jgi:hypothetical protein
MVIIHNDRGYNIGFVCHEVLNPDLSSLEDGTKKKMMFLTTLPDRGSKIRSILESKVEAEKFASYQCLVHTKGHRLSQFAEILTTDFQFDRKKLTVYVKKDEKLVSVCRLVRKLYETFKMRIKVIEIDSIETFQQRLSCYLEKSQLNVSFEDLMETTLTLSDKGAVFLQSKMNPSSIIGKKSESPRSISKFSKGQSSYSSMQQYQMSAAYDEQQMLNSGAVYSPYPVYAHQYPTSPQHSMAGYPQYYHPLFIPNYNCVYPRHMVSGSQFEFPMTSPENLASPLHGATGGSYFQFPEQY